MRLVKYENRELRSFRLKDKTLTLKAFLENKNSIAFFMMTDAIQPQDRIRLRHDFSKYNLNLTFVSKKTITLWMKQKEWECFPNLLLGNVVKIEPKKGTSWDTLNQDTLNFLMGQKDLHLRFLFWNQQGYRKEKIDNYLTNTVKEFNSTESVITNIINPFFLSTALGQGLFLLKNHY